MCQSSRMSWPRRYSLSRRSWRSVPVILLRPRAPRGDTVTISGHINEAPDLFAEQYPFPLVAEGDLGERVLLGEEVGRFVDVPGDRDRVAARRPRPQQDDRHRPPGPPRERV